VYCTLFLTSDERTYSFKVFDHSISSILLENSMDSGFLSSCYSRLEYSSTRSTRLLVAIVRVATTVVARDGTCTSEEAIVFHFDCRSNQWHEVIIVLPTPRVLE
jgi:hypothetical protein